MQNWLKNSTALVVTALVFAAITIGISHTVRGGEFKLEQAYSEIGVSFGIAAATLLVTRLLSVTVTSLGYSVLNTFITTVTLGAAAAYWRADFPSVWMLLLTVAALGGVGFVSGLVGSYAAALVPAPRTTGGFGAKLKQKKK